MTNTTPQPLPDSDLPFCDTMRLEISTQSRLIRRLLRSLHSPGNDLEEVVHDLRVATRRLRAALDVARECLPEQTHHDLRRAARTLARTLGEVRDLDVQLANLDVVPKGTPKIEKIGIDWLSNRLDRKRSRSIRRMMNRNSKMTRTGFADQFTVPKASVSNRTQK